MLQAAKEKTRSVLREMVVCGVLLGIFIAVMDGRAQPSIVAIALLVGLLFSPLLWALYRLTRFVIGR